MTTARKGLWLLPLLSPAAASSPRVVSPLSSLFVASLPPRPRQRRDACRTASVPSAPGGDSSRPSSLPTPPHGMASALSLSALPRLGTGRASAVSRRRSLHSWPTRLAATRGSDDQGQRSHGDASDEEDDDDLTRDLEKIAWLPSVNLGKQYPKYKSSSRGRLSRKEDGQGGYVSLSGGDKNGGAAPPPLGYHDIEIMPVLPLPTIPGDVEIERGSADGPKSDGAAGARGGDDDVPELDTVTANYLPLPHTKSHVLAVVAARYKRMCDDLARLGPPDDRRRFVVVSQHPLEEGVFAEYGVLCQLRDLDEVGFVLSSAGEGAREPTLDELRTLAEAFEADGARDHLLQTRYEATHDVVGRVRIHRLVNPERFADGEDYLRAEVAVLDLVEDDWATAAGERRARQTAVGEVEQDEGAPAAVARAVARVKEELRAVTTRIQEELQSSVDETLGQRQPQPLQLDPEGIKDNAEETLDKALDDTFDAENKPVALVPKGILVERRPTSSLSPPERALRESFAELVALQHFLEEDCRFTRKSVQTFGIGPVGVWLSAAAWGQFVDRRLKSITAAMHAELQEKLAEHFGGIGGREDASYFAAQHATGEDGDGEGEGRITVDFEDLSPSLQREFHLVQGRAAAESGPPALDRAVQMQRLVQAATYEERVVLLRECVEHERRRLEAKKMLRSLGSERGYGRGGEGLRDADGNGGAGGGNEGSLTAGRMSDISREEARCAFERLLSTSDERNDAARDDDEAVFQ